jgi:glutamate racemase
MRSLLPAENFLYVADSGYAPYGERSPEFIRERSLHIANFLIEKGIKALVVACNTATAAAVQELRERLSIPVVAMEPGIKPAVEATKNNVVGVLATTGTLESARFFSLVNRYAGAVEIITQPCAGLVERIEANDLHSVATLDLLRGYVEPLLARGADVIVLGCTHYPFLRKQIENIAREQVEKIVREKIENIACKQIENNGGGKIKSGAGNRITVIDTGPAVARELKRRLELGDLLCVDDRLGGERFWSSGDLSKTQSIYAQLWNAAAIAQLF